MKNDLMKKVGELLDLAGLDQEVIKSVTEKLADENVVLEGEEAMREEEKVEESACPIKHEEEDDEDQKKAPTDPAANEGGYNAVTEEKKCDCEGECHCKDKKEEDEAEDDEVEVEKADEAVEESTDIQEALVTLLSLVKEAYEQTASMKADFEALKEEYAKLVAERIIEEAAK